MIAGATIAAIAAGLYWSWASALSGVVGAAVTAAHGVAGLTIALAAAPLLRGSPAPARVLAGAAASLLALVAAPAAIASFVAWNATALSLGAALAIAAVAGAAAAVASARLLGAAGPVALTALAFAALLPAAQPPSPVMSARPVAQVERDATAPLGRVAVIGLDGADWSVIDPLIEAGQMPNLAALRTRGRSAVLVSAEPTYSPVVWSSIFSGKTPEKHGIEGWYVAHAANRRAAMLWEIVGAAGLRSVVVNVPGSWPPVATAQGAIVSGFPIPSALRMSLDSEAQLLGHLVDDAEHPGPVPVLPARRDGDALVASLAVEEPMRAARGSWRHLALERLQARGLLRAPARSLPVRVAGGRGSRLAIEIGTHRLDLAPGEWSPWLREDAFGAPVHFRVRALDSGIYVTPFFQDPAQPVHAYANAPAVERKVAENGMYVVEGIGWKIAGDPSVRDALFEHLVEVEEQHTNAARTLAKHENWTLFVSIITITDRISHGFWPFRDPVAYGIDPAAVSPADAERVAAAYREADAALGRLLASLDDETTVFVMSDHGFRSHPPELRGDHRLEGIWLAAGPRISPAAERGELGVLDVTPTLLAGLGLPIAKDMDGRSRLDLLGLEAATRVVETYEAPGAATAEAQTIDATTEEQLRSLGYVE